MKLWKHPYHILPPGGGLERIGNLLRVQNAEGSIGYADMMLWPELGQNSAAEELDRLTRGCPTALGKWVLSLAVKDAGARHQNLSLWAGLPSIPESHYFIGGIEQLRNLNTLFKTLKVKARGPFDAGLIRACPAQLRIDWNESGFFSDLVRLFEDPAVRKKIDFLEDPFSAFDFDAWRKFKTQYPDLSLYGDFALEKNSELWNVCDGVVLKPASRDPHPAIEKSLSDPKQICVTHSMGHPLGTSVAAWFAASAQCQSTGLLPHPRLLDSSFEWAERLDGPGFGWKTEKFESLTWQRL